MAPAPSPPSATMQAQAQSPPAFFRVLERKVGELSVELATQATRVVKLEHGAEVSDAAIASLQEKERELLQLLCEQQQEMEQMRLQQQRIKDCVSLLAMQHQGGSNAMLGNSQGVAGAEDPAAAVAMLSSLDLQARRDNAKPFGDAHTLLQELREERGFVAEMLSNVKKEKCEVIATMHTFVLDKGEAMEELEGFRRATREEFSAALRSNSSALSRRPAHAEPKVASPIRVAPNEASEEVVAQPHHAQQPQILHQHPQQSLTFTGRQASRPSLCSGMTMAPMQSSQPSVQQNGGVPHLTLAGVMGQGVTVHPTCSAPLPFAQMHDGFVHGESACRGHSPAPPRVATSPRTLARGTQSPTRQFSSACGLLSQGVMPLSVACSPAVVTRPTVADLRANMGAADPKKSPVRRFVSSGLSPRCQEGGVPAAWAPMTLSQATLIR